MTQFSKSGRMLAAASAALLAVTLSGCGMIKDKASEVITEKVAGEMLGGDVDLDTDGGKITIEGDDGESLSFGDTELPEGWPADAVMPSFEHQIMSSMSTTGSNGEPDLITILTVDAPLTDVVDDIVPRLEGNGFVTEEGGVEIEHSDGEMRTISLLRDDTRVLLGVLSGISDDGSNDDMGTQVTYSISSMTD